MAKQVPSVGLVKGISDRTDANADAISRLSALATRRRRILPFPSSAIRTGIIVCQGPEEEANPTDETYWVQFADHLATGSDPTDENPVDVDGGTNDIVLATNLAEIKFGSHDLPEGTVVELRQVSDDEPQKRWVFNQIPFVWACVFGGLFGAVSTHAAENLAILNGTNEWHRDLMPVSDPSLTASQQAITSTGDLFYFDEKIFHAGNMSISLSDAPVAYFDFSTKKYVSAGMSNVTSIGAAVVDEENDCVYLATSGATSTFYDVYKMTGSGGSYTFTRTNLHTTLASASDSFTSRNLRIITTDGTRKLIWCGVSAAASPSVQAFAQYDLDSVSPSWSAAASGSFSSGADGYDVASDGDNEYYVGRFDNIFGVTGARGVVKVTSGGSASAMDGGLRDQSTGLVTAVAIFDGRVWVGDAAGTSGTVSVWNGASWDDFTTVIGNIGGSGLRGENSSQSYSGGVNSMAFYDNSLVMVGSFQYRQTGSSPQADIPAGGIVKVVKTGTDTYEMRDVRGGMLPIPYFPNFIQPESPSRIRLYTLPDFDCQTAFISGNFSQVSDSYGEYVAGITATAQSKQSRRGGLAGQNNGSQTGATPGVYDLKATIEPRGGACLPTQAFVVWAFGSFSYAINTPQPDDETFIDEVVSCPAIAKQIDGIWRPATASVPGNRITTGVPSATQASDKIVVAGPILNPRVYTGNATSGSWADLVAPTVDPGGMDFGGPNHMIEFGGVLWMAGSFRLLPNPPGTFYSLGYYDGTKYVGVAPTGFGSSSTGNRFITGDIGNGVQMFMAGIPDDPNNDCPVIVQSVSGTPGTWAAVGSNLTGSAGDVSILYSENGPYLIAVGEETAALSVGGTACESAYYDGTTWSVLTGAAPGAESQSCCGALNYWHPCQPAKRYPIIGGRAQLVDVGGTDYNTRSMTSVDPDNGIDTDFSGVDGLIWCFLDASEVLATNPVVEWAKFVTEGVTNYCDIQFSDFLNTAISSTANVTVYWNEESYAVTNAARKSGKGHILRLTLGSTSAATGQANSVVYGPSLNSDWKGIIRGLDIEAFTATLIAG